MTKAHNMPFAAPWRGRQRVLGFGRTNHPKPGKKTRWRACSDNTTRTMRGLIILRAENVNNDPRACPETGQIAQKTPPGCPGGVWGWVMVLGESDNPVNLDGYAGLQDRRRHIEGR